jgi:hypothetical protein
LGARRGCGDNTLDIPSLKSGTIVTNGPLKHHCLEQHASGPEQTHAMQTSIRAARKVGPRTARQVHDLSLGLAILLILNAFMATPYFTASAIRSFSRFFDSPLCLCLPLHSVILWLGPGTPPLQDTTL